MDSKLGAKATRLMDHFMKRGADWACSERIYDADLLADVETACEEFRETAKVRNIQRWQAKMENDDELLR